MPIKKRSPKITYIKFGDVCKELEYCKQNTIITGGHLLYVFSTYTILKEYADTLYISINSKKQKVKVGRCTATNLSPIKSNNTTVNKFLRILHGITLVLKELFKFTPSHILCVRTHGLGVYFILARLLKSRFIVSVHTDLSFGKKWELLTEKYVLRHVDFIICHGPYLSRQARKITSKKTKIIEYNASTDDFARFDHELSPASKTSPIHFFKHYLSTVFNIPAGQHLFTYIGRMETEKGVLDLYEAFKKTTQIQDKFDLCLAGSGMALNIIHTKLRKDRLENRVHVLGKIDRKEVYQLLKCSWATITPTKGTFPEGRCMSAMESLSMGIPLIAPKAGPFEYLVRDQINGLFYQQDSVNDLYLKLKRIMNESLRTRLAEGAIKNKRLAQPNTLSYGEAVKRCLEIPDA